MNPQAPQGLEVIEMSPLIGGPLAAKTRADFGADAILGESPGDRSVPRRWTCAPGREPVGKIGSLPLKVPGIHPRPSTTPETIRSVAPRLVEPTEKLPGSSGWSTR